MRGRPAATSAADFFAASSALQEMATFAFLEDVFCAFKFAVVETFKVCRVRCKRKKRLRE